MMANISRRVPRALSVGCHHSYVLRAQARCYSMVRSVLAVPHHDAISKNEIFNNLYLKKLNSPAALDLSSNVTYAHHPTQTAPSAPSQPPPRKCWAEHVLSQHGNVDDVMVVALSQQDVFNASYASDQKLQFAFVQLKNVTIETDDSQSQIVGELTRMCDDVNIINIKLWLVDDLAAKSEQDLIEFAKREFKQECAI